MDATELGRWTRFAAKGGIGKCTAIQDCVAEHADDLMFLKDDEIVVLMQLPDGDDLYLGYCEGVVGNFRADAVRFHGRLKRPVLTKRQSAALSPISRPSSSQSAFTVAARDTASPAILSPSSSISAAPFSPATSPHPERSFSHASSLTTTVSSAPITPADDNHDSATIASDRPDSAAAPTSPIPLGELAKQLANDSPVEPNFDSFDVRSVRLSQHDRDSSVYDDSEPGLRVSVALSDGGAGIGLSLLQGADSDSDDDLSIRRTHSPDSTVEGAPDSARSDSQYSLSPRTVAQPLPSARSDSQYSLSPQSVVQPLPPTCSESHYSQSPQSIPPPLPSARSESHYSQSPQSAAQPLSPRSDSPGHAPPVEPARAESPSSLAPPPSARSESFYSDSPHSSRARLPSTHSGSDYGGEDWEGADDIYDDYRYSRYSVASKMSRFSKGSMHTLASSHSVVPPMPTEHSRASLDSIQREGPKEKEVAPSKLSESTTAQEDQLPTVTTDDAEEPVSRLQKNRPAPLTFKNEPTPSPLLHATFGSPQASPTQPTATTASFSPTLVSPVYPTNTGAATNLRKRLEKARDDQDDDLHSDHENAGPSRRRSGQDIVVEDRDDTIPHTAMSQAAEIVHALASEVRESPPAVPPAGLRQPAELSAHDEKRLMVIANDDPATDQPPPPPYSASAPPVASGSASSQVPSPAPTPQPGPSSAPPPSNPHARPVDPNRAAPNPQERQSLFMPHPGAPKPSATSAGPMYGRQPAPHQRQ
ncbi:hypothetical protein BD413DRAFT_68728, partial [Trametes elegans]